MARTGNAGHPVNSSSSIGIAPATLERLRADGNPGCGVSAAGRAVILRRHADFRPDARHCRREGRHGERSIHQRRREAGRHPHPAPVRLTPLGGHPCAWPGRSAARPSGPRLDCRLLHVERGRGAGVRQARCGAWTGNCNHATLDDLVGNVVAAAAMATCMVMRVRVGSPTPQRDIQQRTARPSEVSRPSCWRTSPNRLTRGLTELSVLKTSTPSPATVGRRGAHGGLGRGRRWLAARVRPERPTAGSPAATIGGRPR